MGAHQGLVHEEIESLSTQVVTMVAERKGIDPVELTQPLHSGIDPDALEALFSERRNEFVRVTFTYAGFEVTIEGNEYVEVEVV